MATKVIHFNDGVNSYVPVTLASVVQYSYTGGVMSVQDALGTVAAATIPVSGHLGATVNLTYTSGSGLGLSGVHADGTKVKIDSGTGIKIESISGGIKISNTSTNQTQHFDVNGSTNPNLRLDGGTNGSVQLKGTAAAAGQATVTVSYATTTGITIKATYTDTNTHVGSHNINATQSSDGAAYINLSGTDCTGTVGIRGTGKTTVTYTTNGDIVINSTDSDEKVTAGTRTASTKYYLLGATGTTNQNPKYDSNVYLDTTAGKLYAQLAYTATPDDTDNSTRIPTTAWVKSRIGDITGAMRYKGTIGSSDATVTTLPASHDVGDVYIVKTAGTYAGASCQVGDMIICNTAGSTANNGHWTVVPLNFTVEDGNEVIEVPYTATEGTAVTIATVDGKDITTKAKHAAVTYTSAALTALTPSAGGNFTVIGNVEVSNGHVTKLHTQKITLPSDSDTADHILGNSTAATHTGADQNNPYLKIWSSKSNGTPILIQGGNGITATSSNSGKTLTISQNLSTQNVYKTLSSELTNFNPMKYVEVATIDDGINSGWLGTIGNGSTSYSVTNTANTNETDVNATGTTCVAYVKTA